MMPGFQPRAGFAEHGVLETTSELMSLRAFYVRFLPLPLVTHIQILPRLSACPL
jgi:hypothetical protein